MWKRSSNDTPGFSTIVDANAQDLTADLSVHRLNLQKGETTTIRKKDQELSFALIRGSASIEISGQKSALRKLDSFYLPGNEAVAITAGEDCSFYIGGAVYEGYGDVYIHHYDPDLPIGDVRQVHGKPPYQRDVYMTLGPHIEASRLITGLTWSEVGKWSSWPPHQHEKDLEEAYCYFDMPSPAFGIHVSYLESGKPTHAHIVQSGDIVLAPKGYHPTTASPHNKNAYFWVLAAHSHASRRYDLSITDPAFMK
jgi:5-deoxy-glucuronate isomerase